jgi:hypothetical protein
MARYTLQNWVQGELRPMHYDSAQHDAFDVMRWHTEREPHELTGAEGSELIRDLARLEGQMRRRADGPTREILDAVQVEISRDTDD